VALAGLGALCLGAGFLVLADQRRRDLSMVA